MAAMGWVGRLICALAVIKVPATGDTAVVNFFIDSAVSPDGLRC